MASDLARCSGLGSSVTPSMMTWGCNAPAEASAWVVHELIANRSYHRSMTTTVTYMTPGLVRWRKATDGPLLVVEIGSLPLLLPELARNDLPLSDQRFLASQTCWCWLH